MEQWGCGLWIVGLHTEILRVQSWLGSDTLSKGFGFGPMARQASHTIRSPLHQPVLGGRVGGQRLVILGKPGDVPEPVSQAGKLVIWLEGKCGEDPRSSASSLTIPWSNQPSPIPRPSENTVSRLKRGLRSDICNHVS